MVNWEYMQEVYNPSSPDDREGLAALGRAGFEVYHVIGDPMFGAGSCNYVILMLKRPTEEPG
jgi:hypothetical protein